MCEMPGERLGRTPREATPKQIIRAAQPHCCIFLSKRNDRRCHPRGRRSRMVRVASSMEPDFVRMMRSRRGTAGYMNAAQLTRLGRRCWRDLAVLGITCRRWASALRCVAGASESRHPYVYCNWKTLAHASASGGDVISKRCVGTSWRMDWHAVTVAAAR